MTVVRTCQDCGAPIPVGVPDGFCPTCELAGALKLGSSTDAGNADHIAEAAELPPIRYFGDYELIEEIARGGMGIVYRARQLSLNRIVALKMILAGHFAGTDARRRFRAEAEAAARLQHPNIVTIHEVGEHEGQPYFSMDYVEGQSLADLVKDGTLPPKRAAAYLKTIAEAIQFAHEKGTLHRDLKPSNVLIDVFDQPRVTDFGLAKQLGSDSDLTVTGQVLGSPNFMPPEQASGHQAAIDPRSDIYSLGAMLYHVLCSRPPFQGATLQDLLLQVKQSEPVSPWRLNPSVPADLETICLKCLEKEPDKRYGSAAELAEDLGHYLRDEPIRARPASAVDKAWRWCRRQPVVAGLSALVVLLLLTVAIGSSVAALRLKRAGEDAQEKLWESYVAQARAERHRPEAGRKLNSLEAVAKAAAIKPALNLRNEAIASLAVLDVRPVRMWATNEFLDAGMVRFDERLASYARPGADRNFVVRRVKDDAEIAVLHVGNLFPQWAFGFSSSSRFFALRAERAGNCVWDIEQGRLVLSNLPPTSLIVFAPTNDAVANANADGSISLYELPSGHELKRWQTGVEGVAFMEFSPDASRLAYFHPGRRTIEVLDTASGQTLLTLPTPEECRCFGWSSDGTRLAGGGLDGRIFVWDTRTGERVLTLDRHDSRVIAVAFSHSGGLIASTSWDGLLRLWDSSTGKSVVMVPGGAFQLRFSEDDRFLAAAHTRERASILEILHSPIYHCFASQWRSGHAMASQVSPDGRWVAALASDSLRFVESHSGRELGSLSFADARSVLIDANGTNVIVTGAAGVQRWPIKVVEGLDADELQVGNPETILPPNEQILCGSLSEDGRSLAVAHGGLPAVLVFDLADPTRKPMKLDADPRTQYAAISPDGRWVAAGPWYGSRVKVWETTTGKVAQEFAPLQHADVLFSPDGRWFVIAGPDYRLYETQTWQPNVTVAFSRPNANVGIMAFSPDSQLFAVVAPDSKVQLLQCGTTNVLAEFEPPSSSIPVALWFTRDCRRLGILDAWNNIHVWDLPAIRSELAKFNLDWEQPSTARQVDLAISSQKSSSPEELGYRRGIGERGPQVEADDSAILKPLKLSLAFSAGRGPKRAIPPRDPQCGDAQLNLSTHYTSALDESWFVYFENDTLAELPRGLQTLAGVQFDLRGLIQLQGTSAIDGRFPDRAANIRVGRRCQRLHFLQATHRSSMAGREIGHYLIHFTNGSEVKLPLIYGYNLMDWWAHDWDRKDYAAMEVAWTGSNPVSKANNTSLRLFKWTWSNPLPDLEIASIDFVSALNGCAPFVVAVTAE